MNEDTSPATTADEERFAEVVDCYWEGTITPVELADLEKILTADKRQRRLFVDMAAQRCALVAMFDARERAAIRRAPPSKVQLWPRVAGVLLAIAACYGVYLSVTFLFLHTSGSRGAGGVVGSIASAGDCRWADDSPGPDAGGITAGRILDLESGCVEVRLDTGVRLAMEGPARVTIHGDNRVAIAWGKLYAVVPPRARGFSVDAGRVTFIDRGTRFGVERRLQGREMAAVHVLQGRVDAVSRTDGRSHPVRGGEALQFVGGSARATRVNPAVFRNAMIAVDDGSIAGQDIRHKVVQPASQAASGLQAPPTSVAARPEQALEDAADTSDDHAARRIPLVDLDPTEVEFGLSPDPNNLFPHAGAGTLDPRLGGQFLPAGRKIVKHVPEDAELPEGAVYRAFGNLDAFAVEGEFVTGVGLLARSRLQYHWLEYDVPAGAERFIGRLYVSDDPTNQEYATANQQFSFTIAVDDVEAGKVERTLVGRTSGSGEKLADLVVPLPANAKKIRFRLENSAWGDGNYTTELVINGGAFVVPTDEGKRP